MPAADRKLTSRGEERRRQLMAYATERFATNGYHPTSVAEIVRGVGVGKGVFYWYFDSKEALFKAILREAQHELRVTQEQAMRGAHDPLERLADGIRASIEWGSRHRTLSKLVEFAATDERFVDLIRKGRIQAINDTKRHVTAAIDEGLIPDGDPLLLTHAAIGVVNELSRSVFARSAPKPDAVEAAVRFCLAGLRDR